MCKSEELPQVTPRLHPFDRAALCPRFGRQRPCCQRCSGLWQSPTPRYTSPLRPESRESVPQWHRQSPGSIKSASQVVDWIVARLQGASMRHHWHLVALAHRINSCLHPKVPGDQVNWREIGAAAEDKLALPHWRPLLEGLSPGRPLADVLGSEEVVVLCATETRETSDNQHSLSNPVSWCTVSSLRQLSPIHTSPGRVSSE